MDEALKLQFLLQTLGDANRLRIIRFIGAGERSVNEIVSATGLSQPLVSHHLRVLRERQVLEPRRQGPFVLYAVKDHRLLDALGIFLQLTINIEDKTPRPPMFCCPPWWKRNR
jgi:DNA-binding transcriptional ArsR family regulator